MAMTKEYFNDAASKMRKLANKVSKLDPDQGRQCTAMGLLALDLAEEVVESLKELAGETTDDGEPG